MMRRTLPLLSVVLGLVMAAAPTADAVAKPVQAKAACASGSNCWWRDANFSGGGVSWRHTSAPGCYPVGPVGARVRSYSFFGGQEGYFYPSTNCTGSGRPVLYNSESADLGFDAYSFRSACVSCLPKSKKR